MSDVPRPAHDSPLRMTRSHLTAIAVLGLAIGSLTFMLGYKIGAGQAGPTVAVAAPAGFTPDPNTELALEALFREVEAVSLAAPPTVDADPSGDDLYFPNALGGTPSPVTAADQARRDEATTAAATPGFTPVRPAGTGTAAEAGWSIQVGAYPNVAEAEAQIAALQAEGLQAYRSDALTDGRNWYRVRVGGFADQVEAEQARARMAEKLKGAELTVQAAP